jgi:hypothetical protein
LNENVEIIVRYKDTLELVPQVLELEYLEEEDQALTKKVVEKCQRLDYPKR